MAELGAERHEATGVDYGAAVKAGLLAGLIFLILEMVMVPLFLGGSAWGPPRMIGAMVMGSEVLPPPATFSLGVVLVAMLVHFILSVVFAIILAFLVNRMTLGAAIGAGAVFGFVLYLVNFYGFTAIWPWFEMARNWVSVFAHISFGIAAAWAYHGYAARRPVVA
jgi:uncharacterized membrane protein YagU involved in acid resistance